MCIYYYNDVVCTKKKKKEKTAIICVKAIIDPSCWVLVGFVTYFPFFTLFYFPEFSIFIKKAFLRAYTKILVTLQITKAAFPDRIQYVTVNVINCFMFLLRVHDRPSFVD